MQTFLTSVTSRKFLLAIAALVTLAAYREWTQFTVVLLGYLGVQGANDAVATMKKSTGGP